VLPVADLTEEVACRFSLPKDVNELTSEQWNDAFRYVADSTNDDLIGPFYVFASEAGAPPPDLIRCRIGATHAERPAADVVVTASRDAFGALRELGRPCLLAPAEASATALIEAWGLATATTDVRQETTWIEASPPTSLVDALPTLRYELERAEMSHLELVPCSEIVETVTTDAGTRTIEVLG